MHHVARHGGTGRVRVVDTVTDEPAPVSCVNHFASGFIPVKNGELNHRSEIRGKHVTLKRERQMPEHLRALVHRGRLPGHIWESNLAGRHAEPPS